MPTQTDHAALRTVLSASRRPGDEAQWTRIIAAVAGTDSDFARQLAAVLAGLATRKAAAADLLDPPADTTCRCERTIWSLEGEGLGRVDLVFEDPDETYYLLVEHKLGSEYGNRQLERYAEALQNKAAPRKGLIAITAATPLKGEEVVANHPFWLGSLRWWSIFDALRAIAHPDPAIAAVWQASLDLLREQGDFGPMDADPELVRAWSRRDPAEKLLFSLLRELVEPTVEAFSQVAGAPDARVIYRGKKDAVVVWPHRNRPHVKFRVPADVPEERLRVQFYARGGNPHFGVEARYQHPRESLADDADIAQATILLEAKGFTCRTDGSGHHWSKMIPVDDVIAGPQTHDLLVSAIRGAVRDLAESGLFEALAARTSASPAAILDEPDAETDALGA